LEVALAITVVLVLAEGALVVSARLAQLLIPAAVVVQVAVRVEWAFDVAVALVAAAAGIAVRALPISALPASAENVRVHGLRMRVRVPVCVWV
jgi:hypothetical protein